MPTNVLFFLTDQHRTDTLGCYGNTLVRTPNLDRLAASGTVFDRCYTPTAICTPARASLLTGAAPFRHKLLANYERNVGYIEDLSDDAYTVSADLQRAGYQLGLIGKWHVGTHRTAAEFGYDGPHLPGWHNPVDNPDYLRWLDENGLPPYKITDEVRGTFPNGEPGNLLAARLHQPLEATFERYLADRTIELLRQYAADGRPFALSTHFFGPHLPYVLPQEFLTMYDPDQISLPASVAETFEGKPAVQANYSAHWTFDTLSERTSRELIAAYWGYVTMIDGEIGRILDVATELGLMDNTAVFVSADHGEFTGAHRLHDKGPAMYEDIYRVPGIVTVPGGPVQRSDALVNLIDMSATVLDLAGLDPSAVVDGRSMLPLVTGADTTWRQDLLAEFHGHHFPYPQRMLVTERYKIIVNPDSVNEFYDLQLDPNELRNAYNDPQVRDIRDDLLRRLYGQLRDRGDNFYHWMTSMYPVGAKDYDTSLSSFEGLSTAPTAPASTPGVRP